MKYQLKLRIVSDDGNEISTHDVIELEKGTSNLESIGLSLSESKKTLQSFQKAIVQSQMNEKISRSNFCGSCKANLKLKSYRKTKFRTLFGDIEFKNPRYFTCKCSNQSQKSISPLSHFLQDYVSPELYYMESKWSSLMSYGATLELLKDCLPINSKLSIETVRQHTYNIAQRIESDIGEEHNIYALALPIFMNMHAQQNEKTTMGIDGGYLRSWEDKKKNFEVIVGKSIPNAGIGRSFGFVQTIDKKAKRRVYDVLKHQGITHQHGVCFMSDGNDNLRRLQQNLNPNATHVLEWFHITMRITVLGQYVKGLIRIDEEKGNDIKGSLQSIKWKLWHGKPQDAIEKIEDITWDILSFEESYPKYKSLQKYLNDFHTYIYRNSGLIIDYGKRYREGKRISTAFIESLVNSLLNKRFCKKQQMQWKKENAHLLLQIRVAVINNELVDEFRKWYPSFKIEAANDKNGHLKRAA